MMEVPPPPPPAGAAAVVSSQESDISSALPSLKRMSAAIEIVGQHSPNIVRHVSVPCEGSTSSVNAPLSHSLPRPMSKAAPLLSDKKVCQTQLLCQMLIGSQVDLLFNYCLLYTSDAADGG